ncbi:DUF2332 domain-containing protein [Rhizobium sp. YIM 134829]|uniref:DUF2332 domain-containing protein n=1 Tax=Rhizobium sp. YIM 134829 TaxID=3390453 RepID=UPI00397A880B
MSEGLRGEAEVRAAFRSQAGHCRGLGSPFVATLCDLAAERLTSDNPVGRFILAWDGDPAPSADSVPLRFAGALHALVLAGRDPRLERVYPPHVTQAQDLWQAVEATCRDHAEILIAGLASPPQTNEVRRSAALLPGFLTIAERFGLPLCLSEVGASAGLNLIWDHYAYELGSSRWGNTQASVRLAPDWSGHPPPQANSIVLERAGCDLRPVNAGDPEDALRLLSYLWADQTDRIERTRAALGLAVEAGVVIEKADALSWLERRLAERRPGCVHVIYHTIVWQYLPKAAREAGEALIEAAGRSASDDSPLAHLSLESDGLDPGAALVLQLWPTGERRQLGRACFHGRWVNWQGWDAGSTF